MHDVIVVGAGPAGASAAMELARAGYKALILEREKMPRYKTCGGAVPYNFFLTLPERVQKTKVSFLKDPVFMGPRGKAVSPGETVKIAGVMRADFDHAFAQSAVDEGAQLTDAEPVLSLCEREDRVEIRTARGMLEARYVVGADGSAGIVRRSLGLGKKIGSAAALEVEITPRGKMTRDDRTVFHLTFIRDGYAWIFPKGDTDSMGILSYRRDKGVVKSMLQRWAEHCGYALDGFRIHGHPIPVWKGRCRLATRRALLAGDAAGTAEPFGGEGIRYAIKSGRLAAEFIRHRMEGKPARLSYTDILYKEIHSDFKYSRIFAAFYYQFPRFCFSIVEEHPQLATDVMGRVLYGEMSYKTFSRKALGAIARSFFVPRARPAGLFQSE